jgi:hypothetical protein
MGTAFSHTRPIGAAAMRAVLLLVEIVDEKEICDE